MLIKLIGSGSPLDELHTLVTRALSEMGMSDEIQIETGDDPAYRMELGITENPALCIEESSIDFRDMIFQGEIPEYAEILSMFVSILGDDEDHGGCGSDSCGTGGCGSCDSGCH